MKDHNPIGADTHPAAPIAPITNRPGPLRTLWSALLGTIGALVGLAPHVLHHIGLLAGTALIAGAGGTVLFAVLGLGASVPFLLRLRRRFKSWWAPVIGLAVFAVMFSVSAFLIGPVINDSGDPPAGPTPSPTTDHGGHHQRAEE